MMKLFLIASVLGVALADVSHLFNAPYHYSSPPQGANTNQVFSSSASSAPGNVLPIVQYTSPLQEGYQTTFAPPVSRAIYQTPSNQYLAPADGVSGSTSYNAPRAPITQYVPPSGASSYQTYQQSAAPNNQYLAPPAAPAPFNQYLAPVQPRQQSNYVVSVEPSVQYQQAPIQQVQQNLEYQQQNTQQYAVTSSFGSDGYRYRNPGNYN